MKKNYLHERKAHLPFVLALGLIAAPIPALAETEAPHADAVASRPLRISFSVDIQ